MARNDGGPAFPQPYSPIGTTGGMSLRDWFAGRAMDAALHGASAPSEDALGPLFNEIARLAYKMADAMLAEREKE